MKESVYATKKFQVGIKGVSLNSFITVNHKGRVVKTWLFCQYFNKFTTVD